MADNNLPPLHEDDTQENKVSGVEITRPNTPARQDDTEQNRQNRTEVLRKSDATRQNRVAPRGRHVQPKQGNHRRQAPAPGYAPRQGRRRNNPKDSALYLPWWSIVLMLIGVLIVSGLVVGGVILLGNSNDLGGFLAEPSPIILIVTADVNAINNSSTQPIQQAASTEIISGQNAPASLDLAGPTLAPVQISPTPASIRIGSIVVVDGVDLNTLNVRSSPSLTESSILFRAEELEVFNVTDGPNQSEGFTWWQIQDPGDINRVGWAVSNFLTVQTP